MPIEFLYVLPVVAISIVIPVIVIITRHHSEEVFEQRGVKGKLNKEIMDFNSGESVEAIEPRRVDDNHLAEIEKTIQMVTSELSRQQKIIESSRGINEEYSREIESLMSRLSRLKQEYDTVLSENYSLRVKVNNLMRHKDKGEDITQEFFVKGAYGDSTETYN